MSPLCLSRLWTWTGMAVLGGLWLALWWAPVHLARLGVVFLVTPIVLAGLTVWQHAERDRLSMLCLGALVLLFLIAWLV
jgi:hypothetical protein